MESVDLIVLAAGMGVRINQAVPKQYLLLGDVPVLVHPLRTFAALPWIEQKILVYLPGTEERLRAVLHEHQLPGWILVPGGETRQASLCNGLALVKSKRVITHNAAVALVTADLVEQVAAFDGDCVTTANPVQENLVRGGEFAEAIVGRQNLKVLLSPQCFTTEVLRECHERARREGVSVPTDTELMLRYGKSVRLVPGTPLVFKITTPLDLALAESLLDSRRRGLSHAMEQLPTRFA